MSFDVGITSDPLTQFAVVLSALIHDVDHTGAPNAQLIKEGASIASIYRGKSIAEQNSVDLAWSLLMDSSFDELRNTIYKTEDERSRFRQLVVNVVLATDIVSISIFSFSVGAVLMRCLSNCCCRCLPSRRSTRI